MCVEKWKIGIIGSFFWLGVAMTIFITSYFADTYGRRYIVYITVFITILVSFGIVLGNDLNMLYIFVFINGATFGGRVIVSYNFTLEFFP